MKQFLFLIIFVFLATRPLFARVVINEFLIEPTPQAVEIYNSGSESADVSGWYVDDSGGSTYVAVPQETILYPNSCVVVTGDLNLNKSSADVVRLFNSAELIDSFGYKSSSGSGVSYFRQPDGVEVWTTGSATLGKFNVTDQSCLVTPTLAPSISKVAIPTTTLLPTPTIVLSPSPTPAPVSYDNIYISEAYVYPQTGEEEWIELYNGNEFSVKLVDWFIDDVEGAGSSPKSFTVDIAAKGYAVFELSSSMFNNDGDSVRLLDFAKTLKDSLEYNTVEKGRSWSRQAFDGDSFCQTDPTRGAQNGNCIQQLSSSKPSSRNAAAPRVKRAPRRTPTPVRFIPNDEVLGITTVRRLTSGAVVQSLSLASLLQSFLIIISILLKMKKWNG